MNFAARARRAFSTFHDAANDAVTFCPALAGGSSGARADRVRFSGESFEIPQCDYAHSATIVGDEMQVLRLELLPGRGVRTEPHSMMWSDPEIELKTHSGEGGLLSGVQRMFSGGSLFLTEYECTTPGSWGGGAAAITLGTHYPARLIPFDLNCYNGELVTSAGSFVAGPRHTQITSHVPKSAFASMFGGAGLLMQHLEADGVVFLHAGGTIARRYLYAGERMRVNPGCLLAYAPELPGKEMWSVERVQGLNNILLGQGLFVGMLEGPGMVWLQSMPWSRVEKDIVAKARDSHGYSSSLPPFKDHGAKSEM